MKILHLLEIATCIVIGLPLIGFLLYFIGRMVGLGVKNSLTKDQKPNQSGGQSNG